MAKQGLPNELTVRLLAWYGANARDLPWRSPRPEPYRVWLSEIMLQQTTVAAVKAYYLKFLELWPTVEDLANATLDDVLKAWGAGLGYYARARNLHACAKAVAEKMGGQFPGTEEGLRALPGIGSYTAGAIAAIAFSRPHAAIDGNAERVIARVRAIETPLPEAKKKIRETAEAMVPRRRPGDFAQALMDLGATICTPRNPQCTICPWADDCAGKRKGIAASLPVKPAKKVRPVRKGIAFWIERGDGAILLRRRPEKGLLGGMMEVPSTQWNGKLPSNPASEAPLEAVWEKVKGMVEHTFTHFHLELSVVKAKVEASNEVSGCRWVPREKLAHEALPSLMQKVVALVAKG